IPQFGKTFPWADGAERLGYLSCAEKPVRVAPVVRILHHAPLRLSRFWIAAVPPATKFVKSFDKSMQSPVEKYRGPRPHAQMSTQKTFRHGQILRLISDRQIANQEALRRSLAAQKLRVTHATLSRD